MATEPNLPTQAPKHKDDKKHELKLSLMSASIAAAFLVLTTYISGCAAKQAADIQARATMASAELSGKKEPEQSGGFVQNIKNIYYGSQTISRLGDPKIPVSAVFPETKASQPSPDSKNMAANQGVIAGTKIDESLSTDPKVLDSCVGLSPLKLQRVLVESVGNGFNVSLRITNPTKTDVSIWAEATRSLNDNAQHDYDGNGGSNLPGVNYNQFASLDKAFTEGETVGPDETSSINFRFRGASSKANSVSFQANMDYVVKGEGSEFTFRRANLTCQTIPVMAVSAN